MLLVFTEVADSSPLASLMLKENVVNLTLTTVKAKRIKHADIDVNRPLAENGLPRRIADEIALSVGFTYVVTGFHPIAFFISSS